MHDGQPRDSRGRWTSGGAGVVACPRRAKTFAEAKAEAKAFIGREIENKRYKMTGVVSGNSFGKMCSGKAAMKSISMEAHLKAAANVDHLYADAHRRTSHPDRSKDANIKRIHRYYSHMEFGGERRNVKITVKELLHPPMNRIYSVEVQKK